MLVVGGTTPITTPITTPKDDNDIQGKIIELLRTNNTISATEIANALGNITRDGVRPLWTDISNKTDEELINLAIVRIKEEQDFLDNVLIKFVEVLNDLELLEEKIYLMIKYGTDDPKIITCTRNGISLSLAKLLVEKYSDFIHVDTDNDTLSFGEHIIEKMQEAGENEVMITELGFYL